MDSTSVSELFYTRLYRWLLREMYDEVVCDFPLLRRIKAASALEILEVMGQIPEEKQLRLANTIIRKVYQQQHNNILDKIDEPWNENDEATWRDFNERARTTNRYKWLKEFRVFEALFPINLRLLKETIIQKLNSNSSFVFEDEGYQMISMFELNSWKIETKIELHEPPRQILKYYYIISSNEWLLTVENLDLFSYFGISSPWDLFSMQDSSNTADVISTSCQRFIQALPQLLESIGQPEIKKEEAKLYKMRVISGALKEQFKKQYFHWSLSDATREVNESFPFLRKINNNWAADALTAMISLKKLEQLKASQALVKYANWDSLDSENILMDNEMSILYNTRCKEIRSESTDTSLSSYRQVLTIKRKQLRNLIKTKIKPIVGSVIESDRDCWKHQVKFDNWQIITYVELDDDRLSYWHHISDAETGIFVMGTTHILGWLGIGETYWNIFTDADAFNAIEALFSVCEHFMKALPIILNNLDPHQAIQVYRES
ncbi:MULTISPECIES: hypothetical protein [Nostocales]|uniref:Uncharacterized protein n=2 Tax=Nostocales TaxID=1161 RepID=A0A0C1RE44_9CYAN|nr:hypothetical protein [Tolypothrix bouteillei]KAF3886437.1 hypothetical protein DA73_0400013845 [Tolypothrix bouteillei VB521301]